MFIDGRPVEAQEIYELRHPATDDVVATIAKGSIEHLDDAVAAARRSFETGVWADLAPAQRSAIMKRIAERLVAETDELIDLEISCNGATRRQAMGFHVGQAGPHFAYFAELAAAYPFVQQVETAAVPTPSANTLRREPLGVVGAIVPWNFPLVLGIWKIGPALAAGNSVVVKPDEKTPLSLLRLVQIAHEEGVPAGVLNLVTGDGAEVGARLASHPDVAKIAFTGSTAVGREIMKFASGTLKKVSLELGGKGAQIVLPDADLDVVEAGALFACMLYSGQICESGTRLLVHEDMHDDLVERLVARARTLKVGDPADPATDVGPVVSRRQRDRIKSYLEQGKAAGAEAVIGGDIAAVEGLEDGHWIEPTIFINVTNDMSIAREEIFGPVLTVLKYKTVEEAIAIANDSEYGLTGGVWSTDPEAATAVAGKLRAGTVWINNWHMIDVSVPFGGYKQSGVGRELGPHALDEYTEIKHVHLDLTTDVDQHVFGLLLSAG
jgi:acyl-CoA reductase-like NAD-dependent aldehyde dehydrogenase